MSSQQNDSPKISVVMAVYNGEATLARAVDSILAQQFPDFEFIIIDDGSTDKTPEILKHYAGQDQRIVLHSSENQGLTKSLNHGLSLAKSKYLARQDADDVSYPTRFEKQFRFLEAHADISLVGARSDDIYANGQKGQWTFHNQDDIQKIVFRQTPFPHSTVMMRVDEARTLGGYDESFKTSQDMEFWMRFTKAGKIAMLDEALIERGVGNSSISVKRRWRQFYDALRARLKHGDNASAAIFHSLRGLIINLLPHGVTRQLKKVFGK